MAVGNYQEAEFNNASYKNNIRKKIKKEVKNKQYNENKGDKPIFLRVVLPTTIVSLVVGFFLGWLFFNKLRKKRKTIKLKKQGA